MKRVLSFILLCCSMTAMAQTDESVSERVKQKWAVGGLLTLLSPALDYYDKKRECYNPPVPMVWLGPSWLNGGMLGNQHAEYHLKSGIFNKLDYGFTILQISRNLYHGVVGISAGFQLGGIHYGISQDYSVEKDGHYVDFVPSDDNHKNDALSFFTVRIPMLIGIQTNNRLFSLQTGLGLCYTSRPGAQWLATAGLGPFTINLSQNITPLFKLRDGTKAYPLSLTIGVDIWYWLCRFSHPKSEK